MPSIDNVTFADGGIQFTRVTNSQFDTKDEVSVKAFAAGKELYDTKYSYANGKFTSANPIKITDGVQLSYQAVYPSTATFSGTHRISTDQSIAENYEQSDLLVATVDATNTITPVLTFNHVMSNIILNVTVLADGEAYSGAALDVKFNLIPNSAVDVDADIYSAVGNAVAITPYPSVGNGSSEIYNYSVIAAPQTVAANRPIATVVVDGDEVFDFVRPTDLVLQSSKRQSYTFTVDVVTKSTSVEFGGSIAGWDDVIIEDDDSCSMSSTLALADITATSYPTESDSWIITDVNATTEDFAGLRGVLKTLASTERTISLSFPHLRSFPVSALSAYGDVESALRL